MVEIQENTKKFKKSPPTSTYRNRVAAIKDTLPRNYRDIFLSNYPEYDSEEGKAFISQVVALNTTDITVTDILESIALGALQLKT